MRCWASWQTAAILACVTVGLGSGVRTAQGQGAAPAGQKVDCTHVVNRVDGSRIVESRHTSVVVLKPDQHGRLVGDAKTPLGPDYALESRVSLVPDSEPPLPKLVVSVWLVSTEPDAHIVGGLIIDSREPTLELDYADAQEWLRLALEKIRAVVVLEGESKKAVEDQLAGALKPVARRSTRAGGNFDNPQAADVAAKLAARGQAGTLAQALREGRLPNRLITNVTVACFHFG